MMRQRFAKLLLIYVLLAVVNAQTQGTIKILKSFPHDHSCYTQGFEFISLGLTPKLIETCGLYDQSKLNLVTLNNDSLISSAVSQLPREIFAEGITRFNNRYYLLTWRERKVFQLDVENYREQSYLKWSYEGWGLTNNGSHMFTSDGSDKLRIVDKDFNIQQTLSVTFNSTPLGRINQLEMFGDDKILANIYLDKKIVLIDATTGVVQKYWNTNELYLQERKLGRLNSDQCVNGIAYNPIAKTLFLTGKKWRQIYDVQLN